MKDSYGLCEAFFSWYQTLFLKVSILSRAACMACLSPGPLPGHSSAFVAPFSLLVPFLPMLFNTSSPSFYFGVSRPTQRFFAELDVRLPPIPPIVLHDRLSVFFYLAVSRLHDTAFSGHLSRMSSSCPWHFLLKCSTYSCFRLPSRFFGDTGIPPLLLAESLNLAPLQ